MPDEKIAKLIVDLRNNDSEIRWKAAGELGRIKALTAVEPLITLLKNEPEWGPRCGACYALGNIGDKRAVEPLIAALKDVNACVQQEAVDALGSLEDSRAIGPLIDTFEYSHAIVCQEVGDALLNIGSAKDALMVALESENPNIRYWSIKSLAYIGEKAALPLLKHLAQTDDGFTKWAFIKDAANYAIERLNKK